MDIITTFKGDYSFLSNFQYLDTKMLYDKVYYPTNEHFYQAMKTKDKSNREEIAKHPSKGLKAYIRDNVELREDWDNIKDNVMLFGLKYKFSKANPKLRDKLKCTGNALIEEGNWWGDTYWGIDLKSKIGKNRLGKLLMQVRCEILKEDNKQ